MFIIFTLGEISLCLCAKINLSVSDVTFIFMFMQQLPFCGSDEEVKQSIVSGSIKYPPNANAQAVSFVSAVSFSINIS